MSSKLDFDAVKFGKLAVHWVGNKTQEEDLVLSNLPAEIEDLAIRQLLMSYFLGPFKEPAFFHLNLGEEADTETTENEVFKLVAKIFEDEKFFFAHSVELAKYLYWISTHPSIKGGEFFVCLLRDCFVDGETVDALGLFKCEKKETFLKVFPSNESFELRKDQGINVGKLDKGCLIFNTEKEKGFKVCAVDKTSAAVVAQFWKDDFLKIIPREDNFFHTQNYLDMCKGFVENVFNSEHNVDRAEQVEMLNRSANYFGEKEDFNVVDFENEVMGGEPEIIDAFKEYQERVREERNIPIYDEFRISPEAYKKSKKYFRSVIKLDKNFSLYVHGDRDYIEKGFDEEKGMHYYQLYFKEEM